MKADSRRVRANDAVVCAELDDEAILLNVESGIYYGLNAIGTRIWQLLVEGLGEDEIIHQILVEYEVDPVQLRVDVEGFVQSLTGLGLAQTSDIDAG